MKTFIKHFINSISVCIDLKRRKKGNYFFLINVLFIRFFYAFPWIRNLRKPLIKKDFIEKKLFNKKISTNNVLQNMILKGHNSNFKLKKSHLEILKKDIKFKKTTFAFKGNKKNIEKFSNSLKPDDNLNHITSKSKKFEISHVGLEVDLNKAKKIKQFACSKFFIKIAKSYFNTSNFTISGQCYISNPFKINEQEKKDNAQYFHYDLEYKKFFKVFIYLNEVSKYGGPHVFVENSHNKKIYEHILAQRIDEKQVKNNYKKNSIKKFYGPEGHIILEDTFGLHKGEVPTINTRSMLILIYGINQGIKDYNFFTKP